MLTIGERKGMFRRMLKERTFNVVLVSRDNPAGLPAAPASARSVKYNGKAQHINFD
jgi:alpha-D-xyloside xylohydrolase